jgi:RNA polymerase sigma factor (sigma-70 family)
LERKSVPDHRPDGAVAVLNEVPPASPEYSRAIVRALTWVGPDECPANPDREALYEQFQPLVGSLLRRYGKTVELRKDLTGEIYYQFCRLVAAYDPARGIPVCAYLHNMLKQSVFNYVRDYWRKESRYIQLDQDQRDAAAETPNAGPAPVDCVIAQEIRGALPAAIAQLPHRQRLVVVWRYYDGRSFDEIAEQLRVKPATARSLLRHGVNALRKQLGETPGEG